MPNGSVNAYFKTFEKAKIGLNPNRRTYFAMSSKYFQKDENKLTKMIENILIKKLSYYHNTKTFKFSQKTEEGKLRPDWFPLQKSIN